jgi:sterol desaturase/sphingolipid hydroxylase (fatty acid hydroxylase superfamily)
MGLELSSIAEHFRRVREGGGTRLWFAITVDVGLRYFLLAGTAWLLGYVIFKRRWFIRKIVQKFPSSSDVRRELLSSLRTVLIFGAMGMLTITAARHGWSRMYWKLSEHSAAWFWASVAISVLLHDAYFYWTHRLMHRPRWFRWFHRGHHLSMNPSPWASYAFDVPEAVVQSAIFPITVLLVPIHPFAFTLVMLWQITFNVIGHTGYEFFPRWLVDSWLGNFINTPTNHAMHHESMRGNYGLYFNIWDRMMGTNRPDYAQRFREVTSRSLAAQGSEK